MTLERCTRARAARFLFPLKGGNSVSASAREIRVGRNDLAVVPLGIALYECSKTPEARVRLWPVAVRGTCVLAVPTPRDPVLPRIGVRPIHAHPTRSGRHLAHQFVEDLLELLLLSVFDPPARDTAVHVMSSIVLARIGPSLRLHLGQPVAGRLPFLFRGDVLRMHQVLQCRAPALGSVHEVVPHLPAPQGQGLALASSRSLPCTESQLHP
jgi:hypothetical protein